MPSIVHGTIGGNTSKLLNELGQKIIIETDPSMVKDLMVKYDLHIPEDIINKIKEIIN